MEIICMNIVFFHEERNTGWKTIATGKQGYFICMVGVWIAWLSDEYSGVYYLDSKYVTPRKASKHLLTRRSTWRGWDNWWSQDVGFKVVLHPRMLFLRWFDTLRAQYRVSCVSSFRRTSFCSAQFVRVVYLIVDKTILYLIFWLSHGGFMRDPPLLVSQVNPVHELTNYTSERERFDAH